MGMTIEQIQCFLGGLGYYTLRRKDGSLAIDGMTGPSTASAIRKFQADHKLSQDGQFGPMTEQVLRKAIGDGEKPVTKPATQGYKWIDPNDFKCRCGGKYCDGWPNKPPKKTMDLLEQVGEHFQTRPNVHSGLRCETRNRLQGGAPYSRHRYGSAVDFHVPGHSHEEVRAHVETLMPTWGGIGIYTWGIHMDDRPVRGRWDNRGR